MRSLKKDQTITSTNLGTSALDYTTTLPNKPFKLEQVHFEASQAISETLTISVILPDEVTTRILRSVTLVSETEYTFRPQGECNYHAGSQIKVECTNANGVGTVTGEVKTGEVAF